LGVAVSAPPAPAQAATDDCAKGSWASWKNSSYTGGMFYCKTGNVSAYASSYNDETTSIVNWTKSRVYWYKNSNYAGVNYYLASYTSHPNLTNVQFNDQASSTKVG
jgi:hypothetical protein